MSSFTTDTEIIYKKYQEMGEIIYDIKEKITDNEYLTLYNTLRDIKKLHDKSSEAVSGTSDSSSDSDGEVSILSFNDDPEASSRIEAMGFSKDDVFWGLFAAHMFSTAHARVCGTETERSERRTERRAANAIHRDRDTAAGYVRIWRNSSWSGREVYPSDQDTDSETEAMFAVDPNGWHKLLENEIGQPLSRRIISEMYSPNAQDAVVVSEEP